MKFGFFYDGPVTKNNMQYFGSAINDEMFSKYFYVADELEVCIRIKENNNTNGLKEIKDSRINFIECVNLSTLSGLFKYSKAKKIVKNVLQNCEGAFIRLPSRIGLVAIDCCIEMKKPYVIEMVGCAWNVLWHHSIKGKFIALPTFIQTKCAVKNAPAVLYVTKEFLQRRYPTKGISIGCSDVELLEMNQSIIEERVAKISRKFKGTSNVIIGTIGALNIRLKGQQRIIRALGELKKKGYSNFEYQLVGGGNQEYLRQEAIKNNVESQIKFIGQLPHEQVIEWLDTIDLYAQPSKTEGLPRGLIEAMARGLPAIGTNTGGIPELLEDESLFHNNNKSIDEIQKILLSLEAEEMCKQAKRNFMVAMEYDYKKLETYRQEFYNKIFNIT